jgi:hypothetical protein
MKPQAFVLCHGVGGYGTLGSDLHVLPGYLLSAGPTPLPEIRRAILRREVLSTETSPSVPE